MQKTRSLLLVICSLIATATVPAQVSINGSLRGRINDSNAAALAGVTVTLISLATDATQTTTSDSEGIYQFARLAPGTYRLTVEKSGFKRLQLENIDITANENAVADVVLEVGQVSETVTIEAGAGIVQSQSADVSTLIDEQRLRALPLNGKNFLKLIPLTTGIGAGNFHPNSFSISGARPSNNTFAVDGVGSNDERELRGFAISGGAAGLDNSAPSVISTEALQEFRIITSNADATFGRGSGGQINLITKSGTNRFHGAAYEYLRNDIFDARDFFNNGPFFDSNGNSVTPPFKQNLFGASLGGPISRNRHFFFANYEGFRQRLQQTRLLVVPNAAFLALIPGDLGNLYRAFYLERGLIPTSGNPDGDFSPLAAETRADAIAAGFARSQFDGNLANGEVGTSLISTAPTRDVDQDAFLIRTDHQFGDRLKLSARYGFAQPRQLSASEIAPIDLDVDQRRWQSGVAQVLYTLSATQLIEARVGILRHSLVSLPKGGLDERLTGIGLSPDVGVAIFPGETDFGFFIVSGNNGFLDNQTIPQFSAMHTWSRGRWTWRSGFDLRRLHLNLFNGSGQPYFEFAGYVGDNGLFGAAPGQAQAVSSYAEAQLFGVNGGPQTALRGYRSTHHEYFAQADWQARHNLTLNLGLRYSIFSPYSEANNALANLYATDASGNVIADASPFDLGRGSNTLAPTGNGRPLYQPDYNNFQPRLGAAWSLGGRGQTVVRFGYGIYTDRIYQLQFTGVVENAPFAQSGSIEGSPFRLGQPVPIDPAIPSVTGIDPKIRNAYMHRYNIAVEQAFGKETSVSVAYVGALGRKLYGEMQFNGFSGVPQSRRPDPRFGNQNITTNISSSRYDSLQMAVNRRLARGLSFSLSYTLADSVDDSSTESFNGLPALLNQGASSAPGFQGGGAQFVPRPRGADRGKSDFLVRHYFTFTHTVELPFGRDRHFGDNWNGTLNAVLGGWSLNGIAIARSGQPINLRIGGDINDDGDSSLDRPALISGNLSDLYAKDGGNKTQILIPRDEALRLLGTPNPVNDPFAMIERNALFSPKVFYYDASLTKQFRIREEVGLQFEVNAFNVFNHVNFGRPNASLSSSRFGEVTSLASGTNPRQFQFGLKLTF